MLEGLKRWFSGSVAPQDEAWEDVTEWAKARQCTLRSVSGTGFVIDGRHADTDWRLEWGPSQRPYVSGNELRLRAELGLKSDLQWVVMNRELQEAMEKAVFEQYVEGVQTRIDNQTPPEMRWLVMFTKLSASELGPLSQRYTALASIKSWLQNWLQGPMSAALEAYPLAASTPLVIMASRGRMTLRTGLEQPELKAMQSALRLFETALRECARMARAKLESAPAC